MSVLAIESPWHWHIKGKTIEGILYRGIVYLVIEYKEILLSA